MKRPLVLSAMLLLSILPLLAGNSIFSYDGYPVQYYGRDIYSLGMGDTGSSDIFRSNTGFSNPAMHNRSNRSLFSTGLLMGYNAYRSRDSLGTTYNYLDNSLDLPYFSLSVPLRKHRIGFQFNSLSSGVVSNERVFLLPDSTQVTERQEMDRYLFRGDLVYSYNFGNHSLGISGNYYFGHEIRKFVQDANYGMFNTEEELARSYKNPSLTLGYLGNSSNLAWGLYYSLGRVLTGQEVRSSIHEEEDPIDYSFAIPDQIGAGFTFLPYPESKVAVDFQYEPWSGIDPSRYGDAWKVGLGLAYEPGEGSRGLAFIKMPVRTGLSYRKLAFRVRNEEIDELALSLGVTLPLKGDANRIDVGFQYVNRGDLARHWLSDDSFLLMFGFTGFDIFTKASDRRAPRDIPVKEEGDIW